MESIFKTLKAIKVRSEHPSDDVLDIDALDLMRLIRLRQVVPNDDASQYELTPGGVFLYEKMNEISQLIEE